MGDGGIIAYYLREGKVRGNKKWAAEEPPREGSILIFEYFLDSFDQGGACPVTVWASKIRDGPYRINNSLVFLYSRAFVRTRPDG